MAPHRGAVLALLASVAAQTALAEAPSWGPKVGRQGHRPQNVMKHWFGQQDWSGCEYEPPTAFDEAGLLRIGYGKQFRPDEQGSGNIVVLGQHNSGTSMVTRLIMLLGAFAGNLETLSIHPKNKLKYYESFSLSFFHDALLRNFTDPAFRPYHGQGLDPSKMAAGDMTAFDCFARKHIEQDLGRHTPWVTKDPRMSLTMPLWAPKIPDLVCVLVHKDPLTNSVSLASNAKKSAQVEDTEMMTSARWLHMWQTSMEQALTGCRGRPTVVFDSSLVKSDPAAAIEKLYELLTRAGVTGLHLPDAQEIYEQISQHVREGPRDYTVSATAVKNVKGLAADAEVDASMPTMSPRQMALDDAIVHTVRRIEQISTKLNFSRVADDILAFAAHAEADYFVRLY